MEKIIVSTDLGFCLHLVYRGTFLVMQLGSSRAAQHFVALLANFLSLMNKHDFNVLVAMLAWVNFHMTVSYVTLQL